ncbi:hypothetical protein MHU86_24579 [Fragilaria crotonensis]|nr:hypothetical protein MHU86_24579 [Fragilaria crotonensis]
MANIVSRVPNKSERKRQMRFDGLRFAAVKRLQKDVKEYTTVILPCCKHRPSVYNEVSSIAKKLLSKIESIHKEEVYPPDEDFEWFLPQFIPSSIVELQKDRDLLDQLLNVDIPQSPSIRSSLSSIRDQIQADIDTFIEIKRTKVQQMQKEREFDLEIMGFVAEQVEHRPHIYNRVMAQLQKMQREVVLEEEIQSPRRRALGLRSSSSSGRSRSASPLMRWKREEHATAHNRWIDVVTIDEIVDVVPETKVFLRDLLVELKEECRGEAKELQKMESCCLSTRINFKSAKFCNKLIT